MGWTDTWYDLISEQSDGIHTASVLLLTYPAGHGHAAAEAIWFEDAKEVQRERRDKFSDEYTTDHWLREWQARLEPRGYRRR